MKKCIIPMIALSLVASLNAKESAVSLEESLELRRIGEYWKEQEFATAHKHIREFLKKNPHSEFRDQLNAMLGDCYLQDKNYPFALAAYQEIRGREFQLKSSFNLLQCLYKMEKWQELVNSAPLFLKNPLATREQLHTVHFEVAESHFQLAQHSQEEKKASEHYQFARDNYLLLTESKYADLCLHPLAMIYTHFKDIQTAASLYLRLADKSTEKKESFLFQAGNLQLEFDRNAALKTFGKLTDLGTRFAPQAAFNLLTILFQERRYRDFLLTQDKVAKHIPTEKRPLTLFFKGKSHFQLADYSHAIAPLSEFLSQPIKDKAQEKSALLTLIACAKEVGNLELFEQTLAHLKTSFPSEDKIPALLLVHAEICKDNGDWTKARDDLQEILTIAPEHPQREAMLYDVALFLSKEGKYTDAAVAFHRYLSEYPENMSSPSAWRHLINCRIEDVKNSSADILRYKKQDLIQSLTSAFDEKKGAGFRSHEKQQMRYLLAQSYFEIEAYDEALDTLTEYVQDYPKDPHCAEAFLLIASCYQKGLNDSLLFALNVEKALLSDPKVKGAEQLHLTLFNTYLKMAAEAVDGEKADMISNAADHLYQALDYSTNRENHLWLASYFDDKLKNSPKWETSFFAKRFITVLEKLLEIEENVAHLMINDQTLSKEGEVIKLASLYESERRDEHKAALLEKMIEIQKEHPEWQWKFHRMALFELARAYQSTKENEKALELFDTLIATSTHAPSFFGLAATLEKAKLQFSLLSSDQRNESAAEVQAIFDALKTVQVQRKLLSEPLHLEAGLLYITMKAELTDPEQKNQRTLFLLEQMKENFSSTKDPLIQQYLSVKEQFPQKTQLFEHYMDFVNAQITLYDGLVAIECGEKERGQQLCALAESKLELLRLEASEPLLIRRIELSKENL